MFSTKCQTGRQAHLEHHLKRTGVRVEMCSAGGDFRRSCTHTATLQGQETGTTKHTGHGEAHRHTHFTRASSASKKIQRINDDDTCYHLFSPTIGSTPRDANEMKQTQIVAFQNGHAA